MASGGSSDEGRRQDPAHATDSEALRRRSVLITGIAIGVGVVGFLDESILHQLLQWHTFYWGTDEHGRIFSDGLFHVFSTLILLWGVYRLWQTPRDWMRGSGQELIAAILIGGGGFNVLDGIFDHLIMHFHLVNELVCPVVNADNSIVTCPPDIPYEIGFTSTGLVVLTAGIVWWRRCQAARRARSTTRPAA